LEKMRLRARLRVYEEECLRLRGGHTPTVLIRPGTSRCALDHTQGILEGDVDVPPAIVGYPDEEPFVVKGRKPCNWCGALLFPHEMKRYGTRQSGYTWGGIGMICCRQGKSAHLPMWIKPNEGSRARQILDLWEDEGLMGCALREYSRQVISSHIISPP
jgi:hypothetical protein